MQLFTRHRYAISTIFFVNGFAFANLMSRLPEIQGHFQMSNATLGAALFCRAAGALVAMPFAGWLGARFSSNRMTGAMCMLAMVMLSLLLLMPTFLAFVGIFFLFGMAEGLLDINMNEQAVLIEREYQRPIMSSFHAVFSGGMALGAGCGVWMSHAQVALWQHFGMVAALGLFLAIMVSSHFVPVQVVKTATHDQPLFLLPSKAILPLGIIAFCCMTGEGAMADWSAVYMKQILEQSDSFAGFALASFNAAMLIGRSIGDALTRFFGKKRLLLLDSAASALGLIMVLAIPNEWSALVGFFIIGLGLSTIVPIVYSAAGNTPGVKPSTGIAMATSVGYAGFFVGPPVIGFLAEAFDLRIGMLFTLLLFLVMWGMVQRYRV